MDYIKYLEQRNDEYVSEVFEFLKIPSISSQPAHTPDMEKCAAWLSEKIKQAGFEKIEIIPTEGHSIVYAEWLEAGKDAPTVLVYGHYDVQPVDPLNEWHSNPFEPEIRNGKIFARGSADDKCQVYCHIKALEAHFKTAGKFPCNIKLLIEGEEESDSHLDDFIINNPEKLACDVAVISDTEWFAEGMPSICYALRGLTFIEFTVYGPNRDLHSGTFGGGVDNPVNVMCQMIARLKDNYGRVTIPGFYDDVLELSDEERAEFKKLPHNEKAYCEDLNVAGTFGEYGYSTLERTWARPTLDVNGLYGGYTGEGAKTIIPASATAKISMRLVAHQNPEDITRKAVNYIKSIAPPTVRVEVRELGSGSPVLVKRDSAAVKAAIQAFKEAFGKDTVFMREGGSIPIVTLFDTVLHADAVLMGFGLPADNIHSPNESFALENYFGGIKSSALFFDYISK